MYWEYRNLGDICQIEIGRTPSRNKKEYWGEGYDWVSISDMHSKFIELTKEKITDKAVEECHCKIIPPNTLLMSFKLSVGKLSFNTKPVYTNEAIASLYINNEDSLYKNFLYYALQIIDLLKNADKAVKGLTLNKKKLYLIKIPLPPLDIQKKIAAVLDKADRLRQLRKQAMEKLDKLAESVFLDMFGDPVTNPKGWEISRVIDVCDCIVPGRDKPRSFTGNIPWITTDDLELLNYTFESKKKLGLTIDEVKQVKGKIIPSGSVLMTCVGKIGITSIAGRDIVINQQLHSFQCSSKIEKEFLQYILPFKKNYMYKMATLTTVPYMNKSTCNSIPIIIPPINLQKKFKVLFEEIRNNKKKMIMAEYKHKELMYSLTQQAFRGKLNFYDNILSKENLLDMGTM